MNIPTPAWINRIRFRKFLSCPSLSCSAGHSVKSTTKGTRTALLVPLRTFGLPWWTPRAMRADGSQFKWFTCASIRNLMMQRAVKEAGEAHLPRKICGRGTILASARPWIRILTEHARSPPPPAPSCIFADLTHRKYRVRRGDGARGRGLYKRGERRMDRSL